MTQVVAALFEKDGAYLVFQRPENKARGGCYEFVGGKVEPGESHTDALKRECREEIGAEITVGELFFDLVHEYPDITIRLFLYRATVREGSIRLLEHSDMRWVRPEAFDSLPFCPADGAILDKLRTLAKKN